MSDGFDAMIDAALPFFRSLAQNNEKSFFEEHKAHYTNDIRKPAALFADITGGELGRLSGTVFKPKVFRINRDVRFSKDKTPYNTHLHLSWGEAVEEPRPTWFWGLSPDYFILGVGLMGLKGPSLARFREMVDRSGDDLQSAIDGAASKGARISDYGEAPLKRVPKPFDPDHPHAELLKRKTLAMHIDFDDTWRAPGLVKATLGRAEDLMPVYRILADEM